MFKRIFTLLICIFFSINSFTQNCSVSVVPTINTSCDGVNDVFVTVDFSNIDITNWDLNNQVNFSLILPGSSNLIDLSTWTQQNNVIEIEVSENLTSQPGDYLFIVSTPDTQSGICTISDVTFTILSIVFFLSPGFTRSGE